MRHRRDGSRKGQDQDFEAFWRAHLPAVARTAVGITGNVDEGADIAQEAFARAYQHWDRVSALQRPDAWTHRVAVNLSITRLRRLRRRPTVDMAFEVPPAPPDDELLRALRTLPPSQRAVVVLRFYVDLPVEEVAAMLGKRPGTVRALTHQGMQRLRDTMTKEPRDV